MTSFILRHAEGAGKGLTDAGLAHVINCSVCKGFTKKNLIQLHELSQSCQTCPGCYFLQGILKIIEKANFNIATGPWTPLLLTSWNLWGTEHFLTIARCQRRPYESWQVPTILDDADFIEIFKIAGILSP